MNLDQPVIYPDKMIHPKKEVNVTNTNTSNSNPVINVSVVNTIKEEIEQGARIIDKTSDVIEDVVDAAGVAINKFKEVLKSKVTYKKTYMNSDEIIKLMQDKISQGETGITICADKIKPKVIDELYEKKVKIREGPQAYVDKSGEFVKFVEGDNGGCIGSCLAGSKFTIVDTFNLTFKAL